MNAKEARNKSAQNKAIKDAESEKKIGLKEFLEEIKPLLSDYFLGKFEVKDNSLICSFPNGQVIKLNAE